MVWLYLFLGVILGLVVGAIPGLTATMAVTLLLPISFYLPAYVGIPFLVALTKSSIYSGSIPAILVNTPGTGAAAATVLDGYPMARQGKARKALELSLIGSVFGDTVSSIAALFLTGVLAGVVLFLGPPELAIIMILSLGLISTLSGKNKYKGLLAAGLGLLLAAVGIDPLYGASRLTFNNMSLSGGIPFLPMLIGLYAVSEIFSLASKKLGSMVEKITVSGEGLSKSELKEVTPTMFRSTIIGSVIGMIPALGQVVAAFVAYADAKSRSKKPEEFGKGSIEGVTAPETANNAVNGTSLMPLLTLGIPGDTITAVLLAALLIHDISPGPNIFLENGPVVYSMLWAFIFANIILFVVGWFTLRYVAQISRLPISNVMAVVAIFSFVGAYAINSSLSEVAVMILFGLVGYLFRKMEIPLEPLVITFILGPMLETTIGQTLVMFNGLSVLWNRPIMTGLLVVALVVIIVSRKKAKASLSE